MIAPVRNFTDAPPSDSDVKLAQESSRILAAIVGKGDAAKLKVINGNDEVTVPVSALRLLVDILTYMSEGETVAVIPSHAEFTTQQAADFLNVSRPFFVKLLEQDKLPFHMVGSHRRVYFKDLLAYKAQNDVDRRSALDDLAAQSQELGLY